MPANSSKAMILLDLKQNPLGAGPNEANLQTPFNAQGPRARIFLVNHSATQKRQFVKVGVSFKRGANQALASDAELRKIYNISTIKDAVQNGEDMNVYAEKISPVVFKTTWNGRDYFVAPAKSPDEEPPRVQVPEGLWDLLMGNYERMHSPKAAERQEEAMRLAVSQSQKHSPILWVDDDGERLQRANPFGFIEIVRVTERIAPITPDSEFLTALELVEA